MDGYHLTQHPVPAPDGPLASTDVGRCHALTPGEQMLAAALSIVAAGWPVFPCEIGGKRPAVPKGLKSGTTDLRIAADWWEGRYGGCNIAVPTGAPSGPDVFDVDVRPDGSGWAAFNRLKTVGLLAGAHRMVRTPSGGLHLYFAGTDQRCGSLKAAHVDYKAAGGYVLVPPSHVDGRPYDIVDDRPRTGAVFDWEAARRLLAPPQPVPVRSPGPQRGGRVDHLPDWVAQQAEGNRNAALFWAACRAAEAGDQDVLRELVGAAVHARLDRAEAERTVASAVRTVNDGG
jgi:hypothetical protein